mgnify:CR=1 FL=1|jgi:hypothetical protein
MTDKSKVYLDGAVLNKESKEIKDFLNFEQVKFTLIDQSLFEYMFD